MSDYYTGTDSKDDKKNGHRRIYKMTKYLDIDTDLVTGGISNTQTDILLWRGVIYRLFEDLTLKGRKYYLEIRNATSWFKDNSKDYRLVCELAEINSEKLRQAALKIIEKNELEEEERREILKSNYKNFTRAIRSTRRNSSPIVAYRPKKRTFK